MPANLNHPAIEPGAIISDDDCERMVNEGASACSEMLRDEKVERRLSLGSWFWTAYLGIMLVALCAGIAHLLPALKALVNN